MQRSVLIESLEKYREKIENVKAHMRKNWNKFALGAAVGTKVASSSTSTKKPKPKPIAQASGEVVNKTKTISNSTKNWKEAKNPETAQAVDPVIDTAQATHQKTFATNSTTKNNVNN